MKELVHCRAMESLYRQGAALHPEDSWKLLAEAEKTFDLLYEAYFEPPKR